MGKSRFIFRNLNPHKWECEDDVVRALALALDEDWQTVYGDLCSLAQHCLVCRLTKSAIKFICKTADLNALEFQTEKAVSGPPFSVLQKRTGNAYLYYRPPVGWSRS